MSSFKWGKYLRVFVMLMILVMLVAAAGCAPDEAEEPEEAAEPEEVEEPEEPEEEMVEPVLHMPQLREHRGTMTPNLAHDSGLHPTTANVFSRLVTQDGSLAEGVSVMGDLAESWEISDDDLTYTFYLHEGVTWHDGEPLTSADVKYTYDTIIEEGYLLASYLEDVKEIRTPDEHTVVIEMERVNASFLPMLAQHSGWYGHILPKHIYEGTDWEENPHGDPRDEEYPLIGSGPFKFVEYVGDSHYKLEANEDYFRGPPALEEVVLEITPDEEVARTKFHAGEYPILGLQFTPASYHEIMELDESEEVQVVYYKTHFSQDLLFRLEREPLDDIRVRRAIAHAIDREEIDELGFMGTGSPSWHVGTTGAPEFLNTDIRFPEYDPERAEEILDEAGYEVGSDGKRFTVSITGPTLPDYETCTEMIADQLERIDIDVEWDRYESTTWSNLIHDERDFDMTIYFNRFGPDPDAYREHFSTGAARNHTGYSNPEVDELLEDANRTADPEKRKELYFEAQELILEDLPYVAVMENRNVALVREGWEGYSYQESGWGRAFEMRSLYAVTPPGHEHPAFEDLGGE